MKVIYAAILGWPLIFLILASVDAGETNPSGHRPATSKPR